jgi:hypothetical protein
MPGSARLPNVRSQPSGGVEMLSDDEREGLIPRQQVPGYICLGQQDEDDEGKGGDSGQNTASGALAITGSPLMSWPRVFWTTVGFVGAQIGWGVQMGIATPTFRELGVSPSNVALIWLAGPVSGCIVQPVVGKMSDRCTSRWGRRRPFLASASLATCAMTLLFGQASWLGQLLGDGEGAHGSKQAAILIAVFAFWTLDFALNAWMGVRDAHIVWALDLAVWYQLPPASAVRRDRRACMVSSQPMRALASDMFHADQQATVGGVFALHVVRKSPRSTDKSTPLN